MNWWTPHLCVYSAVEKPLEKVVQFHFHYIIYKSDTPIKFYWWKPVGIFAARFVSYWNFVNLGLTSGITLIWWNIQVCSLCSKTGTFVKLFQTLLELHIRYVMTDFLWLFLFRCFSNTTFWIVVSCCPTFTLIHHPWFQTLIPARQFARKV